MAKNSFHFALLFHDCMETKSPQNKRQCFSARCRIGNHFEDEFGILLGIELNVNLGLRFVPEE